MLDYAVCGPRAPLRLEVVLVHRRCPTPGYDVHSAKWARMYPALLRPFPLPAVLVVPLEAERQAGEVCQVPDVLKRPGAPCRDKSVKDEDER
jgi:hypothetical protein